MIFSINLENLLLNQILIHLIIKVFESANLFKSITFFNHYHSVEIGNIDSSVHVITN